MSTDESDFYALDPRPRPRKPWSDIIAVIMFLTGVIALVIAQLFK